MAGENHKKSGGLGCRCTSTSPDCSYRYEGSILSRLQEEAA